MGGAAMSYFAWLARPLVAATTFTVIGNVCKIFTMLINFMIWDMHAQPISMAFLVLSFAGAWLYKQAPLRKEPQPVEATAVEDGSTELKPVDASGGDNEA